MGVEMNTKWWSQYIDGLEQLYGDRQLQIVFSSSSTPYIYSQKGKGTMGQFELLADIQVQDDNGQYVHQLSIDLTVQSDINISVTNSLVKIDISQLECVNAKSTFQHIQQSIKDKVNLFLDGSREKIE